jgi:GMP synthase (glutamine-hydrolysing)
VALALTILKVGSTYESISREHGDFEAWIARGAGLDLSEIVVIDAVAGDALPDPRKLRAVVVSGSPAMVTDRAPWSERAAQWLLDVVRAETPLLGICYGHQLLAHALGGEVGNNPRGRQIGTVDVTLTPEAIRDPLIGSLAPVSHLPVSHLQSVIRLPPGARLLASAPRDPNHAFAVGERAWGVQFHPEFNATIARGYIRERREALIAEGMDPVDLAAAAADTEDGVRLLRRFVELSAR